MNILIITQVKFWQHAQGCDYLIENKIKYLNGYKYLLFIGKLSDKEKQEVKKKYDLKEIYDIKPIKMYIIKYIRKILVLLNIRLYFLSKPFNFTIFTKNKVKYICEKHHIDLAICEYVWFQDILSKIPIYTKKVIETHDIQNIFCSKYIKTNKLWTPMIKKEDELSIYSKFDYVFAISMSDKKYFEESSLKNVVYIPPIYKTNIFVPVHKLEFNIGFIGGNALFNFDAISWFIDNVFPYLDNCILNIYGNVCGYFAKKELCKGIILHGKINDLSYAYFNNHIMINSTFISGGIKTKNVEALSFGKVVLTTSDGARGLEEFCDDICIHICNSPEDYIIKINDLMQKKEMINDYGEYIINKTKELFSEKHLQKFEKEVINKIGEINYERKKTFSDFK